MSNVDDEIKINTKIETTSAIKDLDKLVGKIKSFAKGGATVAAVTTAFKKTTQAIKETTEAYNVQKKAEKQLEQAARNNPYLNNESVKQLENFAGTLQSISTIGDEELIPLMAQLAAAGRTQAEIQEIMTAALDVSASGAMSLEGAVKNLNKTFSGLSGELGESIPQIKELTTEELKQGKAIKVIASQYKGMAEETAKAAGSSQQLKNAWGDLKEEVGAGFERALAPMRRYFTELLSNIASAKKELREEKEYGEGIVAGTVTADTQTIIDYQRQVNELQSAKNKLESQIRKNLSGMGYSSEEIKKELEQDSEFVKLTNQLAEAKKNLTNKTNELDAANKKAKKDATAEQLQKEIDARNVLRDAYDETIRKAQREIEQKRILGENISEEEEAQLMLNTAMEAYIQMMSDPAFAGNNGTYEHEVNARKQIAEWTEKAKISLHEISKMDFSNVDDFIDSFKDGKAISEQIQETIDSLQREQRQWKDNAEVTNGINNRIIELEKLKTKALNDEHKKQVQDSKDSLAEMTSQINSYFSEFSDITNSVGNLILDASSNEASKKNEEISEQYKQGLISYEEYCDKKKEITKKQAIEEYKVKMWEWAASLAQATSNIAQGVTSALALTPPMSFIQAALVSAAGSAQIATLMSSGKPQRPAFEHGGVVGGRFTGATIGSDNVVANLRNGELVLNASQQKQLWMMANGRTGGNGANISMPVTIENNNCSNVQTKLDANGLRIIVDNMVSTSMQQGKYTNSLNIANSKENGVRYL